MIRSSSILTSQARWVDEVIAGAVDLDDIRARLRATMNLITRHRLDAITEAITMPPSVPMTPWRLSGTE